METQGCWACAREKPSYKDIVCPDEYMEPLKESTSLTQGQIQHLFERFLFIADYDPTMGDELPKHLLRRDFLSLNRFARNPLFAAILDAMFGDHKALTFVNFVTFLSMFQVPTKNTKQREQLKKKKLQSLFDMYDDDNDGVIMESDLLHMIHKLLGDVLKKSAVLRIVELIMEEIDASGTGQIAFEDFCEAMEAFNLDICMVTSIPESRQRWNSIFD